MSSRSSRNALATLAVALAVGTSASGAPSLAAPSLPASAPVEADCANPRLPSEILDGPVAPVRGGLRVVSVRGGAVPLRLAVAADPANRELGLMCVTRLRPQHGMIFVFPQSGEWDFWMKNTLVPLDMVWLARDGTVASVAANVPASTRATPDGAVARRAGSGLYTLELNAGEAALDGLMVGTRMHVPALRAVQ